jgi:hypothetical protein
MGRDICYYQARSGITKRAANLDDCEKDGHGTVLNFVIQTTFRHIEVFHSVHFLVLDFPSLTPAKCTLYICYIFWFTVFLQWLKSYMFHAILSATNLKNL